MTDQFPTLYIPHGGGPCFFIKPEDNPSGMPADFWQPMERFLRGIDGELGRRPKAVLVVTAHWMTPVVTIGDAAAHHLLYDYYGFPDYTYELTYPARGAPDVAARVAELLGLAGIASLLDDERGIDHGVFIPFKLIYPDADVPIVPLSLRHDLDAAAHIAIGQALAPLRGEDVLIVGSGMSFHNMQAMRTGGGPGALAFDDWLQAACTAPAATRSAALARWDSAPGGRWSHPQEEHLIPLMVAAGAAGLDRGRRNFADASGPGPLSAFIFG